MQGFFSFYIYQDNHKTPKGRHGFGRLKLTFSGIMGVHLHKFGFFFVNDIVSVENAKDQDHAHYKARGEKVTAVIPIADGFFQSSNRARYNSN